MDALPDVLQLMVFSFLDEEDTGNCKVLWPQHQDTYFCYAKDCPCKKKSLPYGMTVCFEPNDPLFDWCCCHECGWYYACQEWAKNPRRPRCMMCNVSFCPNDCARERMCFVCNKYTCSDCVCVFDAIVIHAADRVTRQRCWVCAECFEHGLFSDY
jgi:hypothetical protein